MSRYAKALVALFTALGTWGMTAASEGYDQVELWGLCGVAVTFLSVFAIPNTPPAGQPRDPFTSETVPDLPEPDDIPTTGAP